MYSRFETKRDTVVSRVAWDQHVQTLRGACRLSWIFADLYHLTTYVAESRVQTYKEIAVFFANFPSLYNSWFSWLWISRWKLLKWISCWVDGPLGGTAAHRNQAGEGCDVWVALTEIWTSFSADYWADQGRIWQILFSLSGQSFKHAKGTVNTELKNTSIWL